MGDTYKEFGFDWMENHDHHAWHGFMHARRGDLRPAVMLILTEGPMHGYEIMRRLEEKAHGFWRPSPGSIYPTLQLLVDEDLVSSHDEGGKKIYELTEKGREEIKGYDTKSTPWDHGWHKEKMRRAVSLRSEFSEAIKSFRKIIKDGDDDDLAKVKSALADLSDKLAAIAKNLD